MQHGTSIDQGTCEERCCAADVINLTWSSELQRPAFEMAPRPPASGTHTTEWSQCVLGLVRVIDSRAWQTRRYVTAVRLSQTVAVSSASHLESLMSSRGGSPMPCPEQPSPETPGVSPAASSQRGAGPANASGLVGGLSPRARPSDGGSVRQQPDGSLVTQLLPDTCLLAT